MDRVYRRIMVELLDDIVTGVIARGTWLPSEEEIAARHACGRPAAREAVRALEERGVVEVQPGSGQRVLETDRWSVLDADVAEALLLRHPDGAALAEAVRALRVVEVEAAQLAAPRIRDGDVALLREALELMSAASADGAAFAEAEAYFHRIVMLVSGNRYLAGMLESLQPVLARVRRHRAPERDRAVVRLHEAIVAALDARDPLAAAAAAEAYARHMARWLRA
jgi:GntR family transcriptional repressor for pyruvate dehydrogenase complex